MSTLTTPPPPLLNNSTLMRCIYSLTLLGVKVSGCLLQALTPKTAQQLTADHLATGGMIPKINSALSAVKRGVHHFHITNTVTQPGTVVTL